jgi:hypothetical protein
VRRRAGDQVKGMPFGKPTVQGVSMTAMDHHGESHCWIDLKIIYQRRVRRKKSQVPLRSPKVTK